MEHKIKAAALPAKQQLLLAARLAGLSMEEAAEKAGLKYGWVRQLHCTPKGAKFRAALEEGLAELSRLAIESSAWTQARVVSDLEKFGDLAAMFGDFKGAIKSRSEIAQVLGLSAPKRVESTVQEIPAEPPVDFSGYTDEELEEYAACQERLEAIAAAANSRAE